MPRILPIMSEQLADNQRDRELQRFIDSIDYFSKLPDWQKQREAMAASFSEGDPVSLLDLGCDVGDSTRCFVEKLPLDSHVVGIDESAICIALATKRVNHPMVRFTSGSLAHLPFPDNQFDIVYAERILHAEKNTEGVFHEIRRVLKKKGRLLLCEPLVNQFACSSLTPFINQQLQHFFSSRVAMANADEALPALLKKEKWHIDAVEKSVITITSFDDFNRFYDMATLLAFLQLDYVESAHFMEIMRHPNNFRFTLPMVVIRAH